MTADAARPHYTVQKPRRRTEPVDVADVTMLVQVPGRPAENRSFTDAEVGEARQYADETGGSIAVLPLSPPRGYVVGPGGTLVPTDPETSDAPNPTTEA